MSAMDQLRHATPEDADRRTKDALKRQLRLKQEVRREVEAESQGPTPQLIVVSADQLPTYHFPLREALLHRDQTVIFRAGHIGEVYAMRGIGKTWLMLTLGLMVSTGGSALGLTAARARRVLYVDGEMASEDIRERLMHLTDRTGLALTDLLQIVGADWQQDYLPRLDTAMGQAAVEPFIEQTELIILDNRSCLFDPEGEKDATAWQPAGDWLLSLRRRGKAVILAHHANRQGGARGHSKAEDPMDLILKLTRPEGYMADQGARFVVEIDKGRGVYGPAAAPFIADLTPNGWIIEPITAANSAAARQRKALDVLCAVEKAGDKLPKSGNEFHRLFGGNRAEAQKLWAELKTDGTIVPDAKGGFRLKF